MNKYSINSTVISNHTMNLSHTINKSMRNEIQKRGIDANDFFCKNFRVKKIDFFFVKEDF